MIEPIRPEDIGKAKKQQLPESVIKCWNDAIAAKFSSGSAEVEQRQIQSTIASMLNISSKQVYDLGYLDIEEVYREAGWSVKYEKPDYTESFPAKFIFTKKRR